MLALIRDNYITLYNIYRDRDGEQEEFNRTVFFIHFEEVKGKKEEGKNSGTAEEDTSTHTLFVPFAVQSEVDKTYVEPEEYLKLKDHSKVFTFRKGDIVVKGKLGEEISTEKEFILSHPQALRVQSCKMHNFGSMSMRHWEVYCD